MKFNILKQCQKNDSLLLFFNGWGMEAIPDVGSFDKLWHSVMAKAGIPDGCDIVQFYDYSESDCEFDLSSISNRYSNVYLLAWSLGIWAAVERMADLDIAFNRAVAVNGTYEPVSDTSGISPEIFQGTIDNWSESGRSSFNRRMCRGKDVLAAFVKYQPQRDVSAQKEELIAMQKRIIAKGALSGTNFDCAVVGRQDRIFQSDRQKAFWQSKNAQIIEIDASHCPVLLEKS